MSAESGIALISEAICVLVSIGQFYDATQRCVSSCFEAPHVNASIQLMNGSKVAIRPLIDSELYSPLTSSLHTDNRSLQLKKPALTRVRRPTPAIFCDS